MGRAQSWRPAPLSTWSKALTGCPDGHDRGRTQGGASGDAARGHAEHVQLRLKVLGCVCLVLGELLGELPALGVAQLAVHVCALPAVVDDEQLGPYAAAPQAAQPLHEACACARLLRAAVSRIQQGAMHVVAVRSRALPAQVMQGSLGRAPLHEGPRAGLVARGRVMSHVVAPE